MFGSKDDKEMTYAAYCLRRRSGNSVRFTGLASAQTAMSALAGTNKTAADTDQNYGRGYDQNYRGTFDIGILRFGHYRRGFREIGESHRPSRCCFPEAVAWAQDDQMGRRS
jgi:hypothetical protein